MAFVISDKVKVVEGVIGVDVDPCTPPACQSACLNILGPKLKSSHCATLVPGAKPVCLCTGGSK
ncbi:hypothetical protein LINGRAPRIM_LOCUS3054 [Linum grandiflorum]